MPGSSLVVSPGEVSLNCSGILLGVHIRWGRIPVSLHIKGEQGHRLLGVRLGGAFLPMCAKRYVDALTAGDTGDGYKDSCPSALGGWALYMGQLLVSTSLAGLPPCLSAIGRPFPGWSQRGLGSTGHFQEQGQGQRYPG